MNHIINFNVCCDDNISPDAIICPQLTYGRDLHEDVFNSKVSNKSVPVNLRLIETMQLRANQKDPISVDLYEHVDYSTDACDIDLNSILRDADLTNDDAVKFRFEYEDSMFTVFRFFLPNVGQVFIDIDDLHRARSRKLKNCLFNFTKPDTKNVVYYHNPCRDGMGSYYAAWLFFGSDAEYIPFSYGTTQITKKQVAGKDVFFLDASVPYSKLLELSTTAESITIVDHHKSAFEDYDGKTLPSRCHVHFDMEHSGAVLTWKHFFGNVTPPYVLRLIEDRDLWKFDLEGSRDLYYAQISDADSLPSLHACATVRGKLDTMLGQGRAVSTFVDSIIQEHLTRFIPLYMSGYTVHVVNCDRRFASDVLNAYLELHPDVPYVASYHDEGDVRRWSLRSIKGSDNDVAAIAELYNGGGHKSASGFVTQLSWDKL